MAGRRITYAAMAMLASLAPLGCQGRAGGSARSGAIRVVVVTGGHDFQETPFRGMFASFQDMAVTYAPQQDDSELFQDVNAWDYDVVVLYNMSQRISAQRQENLLRLVRSGVGVVAVHHALAAFQDWEGYADLIGGRYFLSDRSYRGTLYKTSTYKHDERLQVQVADTRHPVTRGLQDFEIIDEAYKGYAVAPDSHVLLQTDHPLSEKAVAWVSQAGPGRVVTLALGHDGQAYGHEAYRRLLRQAIEWCSKGGPS